MYAIFKTSKGKFIAFLDMERAPITAGNFKGLAEGSLEWKDPKTGSMVKRPFYDGLTFHRVAKDFVIQGGCPLGRGTGGPGHHIKLECHPELKHDRAGVLSMARSSDPDSAGSQFFVTLKEAPFLDDEFARKRGGRGYAAFGHVVEGLDVVKALGDTPIEGGRGDGSPVETLTIERVVIVDGSLDEARTQMQAL